MTSGSMFSTVPFKLACNYYTGARLFFSQLFTFTFDITNCVVYIYSLLYYIGYIGYIKAYIYIYIYISSDVNHSSIQMVFAIIEAHFWFSDGHMEKCAEHFKFCQSGQEETRPDTLWASETWETEVPGASISGQDCDELLSLGRRFEFVLR